jgi:thiamine-monophosphate kinase|tara:strand:+ start:162505 stop:163467 length:963 start_codon:yes stop_codon:yes gene_type:complete
MADQRLPAESDIIARLRRIAPHPAARSLSDDAAVWLPPLGRELVLTHDAIAANVHYLPGDDPSDIAWKLVATNLSDLAAKGATPRGVLLGLTFSQEDDRWTERFCDGLARVLGEYDTALFGGDTIRADSTTLGCTAIGDVEPGTSLARGGAMVGDDLYVTGSIGDAGLGLAAQRGDAPADKYLQRRYRLPMPRLAMGQGLFRAGATAAMDVSDGLLIDARRLAEASGIAIRLHLSDVPLSTEAAARLPSGTEGRLLAATAGDDYELLFSAPPSAADTLHSLGKATRTTLTRIGGIVAGAGLSIVSADGSELRPERLGFEH